MRDPRNEDVVTEHTRPRRLRSRLLALGATALLTAATLAVAPGPSSAAAGPDCSGQYKIDRRQANGARWTMCWRVRARQGLTLDNVTYTPRGGQPHRVLASAALAQIYVAYDAGTTEFNDLGAFGDATLPLRPPDCPGGELRAQRGAKLLCLQVKPRGYAYKSSSTEPGSARNQLQGTELVLFTAAPIGWYTYITQWRFADDGTITAEEGATGSLSPGNFTNARTGWPIGRDSTRFSENHTHNVFWRLDFDVEGTRNDVVQQFDVTGNGTPVRQLKKTVLDAEGGSKAAPMRFWRVADKNVRNADHHQVSWDVDVRDTDQVRGDHAHAFTHKDLWLTQYRECEELVADNADGRCANSVDKFVNGERLTDPVVWVQVDFHHVPRDEDEDPMPIHWQGFKIVPRDVTATSPLP